MRETNRMVPLSILIPAPLEFLRAFTNLERARNRQDYPPRAPALAIYATPPDMPPDNGPCPRNLSPSREYHRRNDAGHFLMTEQANRFDSVLSAFLKAHFPKGW